MLTAWLAPVVLATLSPAPAAGPSDVTLPREGSSLGATLIDPDASAPLIVILAGSGPTNRDGNSHVGLNANSYRLLAEGLALKGVASLRIDKRGVGASAGVALDAASSLAPLAEDALAWAAAMRQRTGRRCVWLLGHSEGGLVALQAAARPEGLCGVVLVSTPGRSLATILREQFRANPANAPILDAALGMIDSLERGVTVDPATLPSPLGQLFPTSSQAYLAGMMRYDPATMIAGVHVPVLIVQGDTDLQVKVEDARALSRAQPRATLTVLSGVNHVLKRAPAERMANLATYANPALPIAPGVVDAIAGFVKPR